jgi:hypothetical protein
MKQKQRKSKADIDAEVVFDVEAYGAKILPSLGLDAPGLIKTVTQSAVYERENREQLRLLLEDAGWDMSRLAFGSIMKRVEW